eukprot:5788089-Prymnesium_polylepis.1
MQVWDRPHAGEGGSRRVPIVAKTCWGRGAVARGGRARVILCCCVFRRATCLSRRWRICMRASHCAATLWCATLWSRGGGRRSVRCKRTARRASRSRAPSTSASSRRSSRRWSRTGVNTAGLREFAHASLVALAPRGPLSRLCAHEDSGGRGREGGARAARGRGEASARGQCERPVREASARGQCERAARGRREGGATRRRDAVSRLRTARRNGSSAALRETAATRAWPPTAPWT